MPMYEMPVEKTKHFYTSRFMNLADYRLEKVGIESQKDAERWNEIVEKSEQGTIFSRLNYLAGIDQRAGLWYCYKNKEFKAAVAIMEDNNGKTTGLHEFVIYNGIMFIPQEKNQNRAQIMSEQFQCTCFIVEALSKKYDQIRLSMPPFFTDIRPFLWHNYGKKGPHYLSEVLYTSFVNIKGFDDGLDNEEIPLYTQASTSRRQEIRYAQREGVYTKEEFNPSLFLELYERTMWRQQISCMPNCLNKLFNLIVHLGRERLARMFISHTAKGEPGSAAIFCIDSKRAYYLFGANNPELRNSHTGTAVLWHAFRYLNQNGVQEVDLEGINSPQRGYFKLSFGGNIIPYYHLALDNRIEEN